MDVPITALETGTRRQADWLRSRDWDLTWITLSVVLVSTPYLAYLGLLNIESIIRPIANTFNASVDSLSRNIVNAVVALLVGGPHMYATFTRTALDRKFARKHRKMMWSSLIIPVVVITLAMLNLPLLLTLFFFWASIHVLHQIIYIIELYNHKQENSLTLFSRWADYGVVLTALYPLAAWKVVAGTFLIGTNDLSAVVSAVLPVGPWMVWLAGGAFGIALAVWTAKTITEYRQGSIHWPKTAFIALTVIAAFFVPALGNLDTAFQGMNVWHSLQYLALTWMLNHLRQKRGDLETSPFVKQLSEDGTARRYYLFNFGLTIADVGLAGLIFVVLLYVFDFPFDYAFDRAYYIAVLSFLWIHYYHDHFLFSQPEVIAEPGQIRSG
ncbi:MAG TPA: hypothetical protein VIK64_14090 [Anaerolineales bacterium]